MKPTTAKSIVRDILANDASPPSAEYNPFDFGAKVGATAPSDIASDIVYSCFVTLPGTLAASFLDGFLTNRSVNSLDSLFMVVLPETHEIGSASVVVEFLQKFCGLDRQEIADRILDCMHETNVGSEQDRLAIALWSLICGESYDVGTGTLSVNQRLSTIRDRIAVILSTVRLSTYSDETLRECIAQLDRID